MDLLQKLEKVERFINVYSNKADPELIVEIKINLPVEKLREVVTPDENDMLLYKGYMLEEEQVAQLNNMLGNIITPDFQSYDYVLEAVGHYNW